MSKVTDAAIVDVAFAVVVDGGVCVGGVGVVGVLYFVDADVAVHPIVRIVVSHRSVDGTVKLMREKPC